MRGVQTMRRWSSSFSLARLNWEKATQAEYKAAFAALKELDMEKIHVVLREAKSNKVRNALLSHGLQLDFSLYHTLKRAHKDHEWSSEALLSLIKANSGRMLTLWQLMTQHGKDVSRDVKLAVVDKLLKGETAEEGEHEVTVDKLDKAISLLKEVDPAEAQLELLLPHLIKQNSVHLLAKLRAESWLNGKLDHLEGDAFVQLATLVFEKDPRLLLVRSLCGLLRSNQSDAVLAYVDQHKLDRLGPESVLLRLQLLHLLGIDNGDIDAALKKFHLYLRETGLELIQAKMVQVFCFQAFRKNDETLFGVAEALVPPEITVRTICHLMLASSLFGPDRLLAMYNDYIQNVSSAVQNGQSSRGALTRALILASFYNHDREFAQVVLEKAAASGIVAADEVPQLQALFKVYGDAYKDDSWETARPVLKAYILGCLSESGIST